MKLKTALVDLTEDKHPDPRYAVCYARGQVFKSEGSEIRVELGKRTLVNRALCVQLFYKERCQQCPNSDGQLTLKATGTP